jgi:parallel beta-helix repeat protein
MPTPTARPHGPRAGCACNADSDCEAASASRRVAAATGGCECAGDTEGHGIILDMARGTCTPPGGTEISCGWNEDPACGGAPCALGEAGNFVLESNIIYRNEGDCVSIFKSAGATVRNNVCWQNGRRPSAGEAVCVHEPEPLLQQHRNCP